MVRSVVCEIFYISAQNMNVDASPLSRCSPSVCAGLPGWNAVTAFPATDHVVSHGADTCPGTRSRLTHVEHAALQQIGQQQPSDLMLVGCGAHVS